MKSFISSLGMWVAAIVMITLSAVSFAQTNQSIDKTRYQFVENVEELLDNIARYDNKKVRVPGEVEEIDRRAFILESGGVFQDEIIVVMPETGMWVREDADVIVAGTVRTISIIEIEREYGLDLDPEIEIELKDREAFLIAERIEHRDEEDY